MINGTDFGGTETKLCQLAGGLTRIGHQVQVLSLKPLGRLAVNLRDDSIEVSSLNMREVISPRDLIAGSWVLRKWLRQREFDLIHAFLPRASIMSRMANRFAGRCVHLSSEESTDYNRSPIVTRINRWTSRWTDVVLALSTDVRRVVIEREGIPEEKVRTLGNWIALETIDRQPAAELRSELGLGPERLICFTAGRLVHDKGYLYLLQALARARRRGLDLDLVLAGDGPQEAQIREEVERLALADRVHLLGFRRDVVPIMKASDLFVLPSLEEGIPIALLEAMACSLPVIASRVGGVPDVVSEGETAILVPACEAWGLDQQGEPNRRSTASDETMREHGIQALTEALETLVQGAELRRELGRRGRRRIEERFSLEVMLEQVLEIYESTGRSLRASRG